MSIRKISLICCTKHLLWARNSQAAHLHTSSLLKAPKKSHKKSEGASAKSQQDQNSADRQIFNIYKDRQDHRMGPKRDYPDWLHHIGKKLPSYGSLAMKFIHGRGIEKATFEEYLSQEDTPYSLRL